MSTLNNTKDLESAVANTAIDTTSAFTIDDEEDSEDELGERQNGITLLAKDSIASGTASTGITSNTTTGLVGLSSISSSTKIASEASSGVEHSLPLPEEIIQDRVQVYSWYEILMKEIGVSLKIVLNNQLNWLLIFAPVALVGASTEKLGEAACFLFAGLALIPCAERYVLLFAIY